MPHNIAMNYTAEEVRGAVDWLQTAIEMEDDNNQISGLHRVKRLLATYAALLEQREAGVTDEIVKCALNTLCGSWNVIDYFQDADEAHEIMRVALTAVWPAAAEPATQVDEPARERVAKAIADVIGHGMSEKCYPHADAAIAALSDQPLTCESGAMSSELVEPSGWLNEAWHKSRNAWLAASRHGTQEDGDNAAIAVLQAAQPVESDAKHEREIAELIDERDRREEIIDCLCDAVLGQGRPEWSSAYGYDDALLEVQEAMFAQPYTSPEQPAERQGEAVAYWAAIDVEGEVELAMSTDDANGGGAARQEVNDYINDRLNDDEVNLRLAPLYTHPAAPVGVPDWTDAQCMEFLSVGMRHVEIVGNLRMDEIRQGAVAANKLAAAPSAPQEP